MVWAGGACIWVAVGSQACGPESCTSLFSTESLSGEEQCTSSAPGAPKAWPATAGLGSRIRAIQESVGKVSARGGKAALWDPEPASGPPLGLGRDDDPCGLLEEWAGISYLNIVIPELPLFCLLAGAAGGWLVGMRVESEVQRDLSVPQHTHESASPVSFGSLLMKQDCPLRGVGRGGCSREGWAQE